jgi:predicted RNA-binding protein with TRAM domain
MSYSYNGRTGNGSNHDQPVEMDKEYEARIEDISRKGDGVAKIEGFIVFVPNTKQGDQVKFKIKRVGNRFAIGELVPS